LPSLSSRGAASRRPMYFYPRTSLRRFPVAHRLRKASAIPTSLRAAPTSPPQPRPRSRPTRSSCSLRAAPANPAVMMAATPPPPDESQSTELVILSGAVPLSGTVQSKDPDKAQPLFSRSNIPERRAVIWLIQVQALPMRQNNYGGNYILCLAFMPIPTLLLLHFYPTHPSLVLSVGISTGLVLCQLVPPRLRFGELIYRIIGGILIGVLYALYSRFR
jgi:hypothetical protein